MRLSILITLPFFLSTSVAYSEAMIEYRCNNRKLVSDCEIKKEKRCLKPDAMTNLFDFTFTTKHEMHISKIDALIKRFEGELTEGFVTTYTDRKPQYYPSTGKLKFHTFDGKEINQTLDVLVHNFAPEGFPWIISEFLYQKDDLEINGKFQIDVRSKPDYVLLVKKKDTPVGDYIFAGVGAAGEGYCEVIGQNPLPKKKSKKSDAGALFK